MPRLGIAGSAFATFIAQTISLTAMVRHLYRRRHLLCLHGEEMRFLRIDWSLAGALLRKGMPMGGQIMVMSLSGVLMIALVNRFGVDTTAAFGAALQIWNYIQMPAFAVGRRYPPWRRRTSARANGTASAGSRRSASSSASS